MVLNFIHVYSCFSEYELGSLPQYDSGDLSELVKRFTRENGGNEKEGRPTGY